MVFNDSIFATPRPSFERPVPLVLVDPWDAPLIYLKLNVQWMPYVLGSLRQLVLQSTWDTTDPAALDLVQARAMSLINLFTLALDNSVVDDCCREIALTDPRLAWLPADPFTCGDCVPAGYHFPPWFVAPSHTVIPGVQMGDLVTDILHAPYNPLATGFPRVRITVDGPGTIEIKFIRFPTASIALWTIDGDLSTSQWTDLHVTLEAAIGRFDPEMVIPIEVEGTGPHVVDVSIIASISEEPPFVHFGGGIRSISLCGFEHPHPTVDTFGVQVEDNELNLRISPDDPCIIQIRCGEDSWINWYDPRTCITEGAAHTVIQPSADGVIATGECKSYSLVVKAKEKLLLPVPVQGGMTLDFSGASGGWTDGTIAWFCPDGSGYALGTCNPACSHEVGDPSATACHMAIILKVGTTYYAADGGVVTIPAGVPPTDAFLMANDATLSDNDGSVSVNVEICQVDAPDYCFEWDYSIGAYDYAVQGCYNHGVYTPTAGFKDTVFNPSANAMAFERPLAAPVTLTKIEFDIDITAFAGTHVGFYPTRTDCADGYASEQDLTATGLQTLTWSFPSGHTLSDGWMGLYGASDAAASHWTVKKCRAYGYGTNPFGANNC